MCHILASRVLADARTVHEFLAMCFEYLHHSLLLLLSELVIGLSTRFLKGYQEVRPQCLQLCALTISIFIARS